MGREFLKHLIRIFKIKKVIALGRKSESQLREINVEYKYVRHPANGGKNKFINGIRKEIKVFSKY